MPTGTIADIPAVENEISGLTSLLHRQWLSAARIGIDEAVESLRAWDRTNGKRDAAIIAAFFLLFLRRRVEAPLPAATRGRIFASAQTILSNGIRSTGIGGGALLGFNSDTFTSHASSAVAELEFMHGARLQGTAMAERITARVIEHVQLVESLPPAIADLDLPALPAPVSPAPVSPVSQVPPATPFIPRAPIVDRLAVDAAAKIAQDLESLRERVTAILADTNAALSEAIADAWAYRVHNVGIFLASREAGVQVLVAENPMDDQTTPFCRWVHGKVISVTRVERQLANLRAAVDARDKERLISSWPFFNGSKKSMNAARADLAQDRPRGARISDAEIFRRFFSRVGLPPYHWRCRTRARPR